MENYIKGEVREVEQPSRLTFASNVVHMKVQYGSKVRNLIGYAVKKMKEPDIRQMTWNASGNVVSKAISCAEIMKKKYKDLHQVTDIRYKRFEEYWEPRLEGLECLKVNRDVPVITILLSKDPLDTNLPGYQGAGEGTSFWSSPQSASASKQGKHKTKGDPKQGSHHRTEDAEHGLTQAKSKKKRHRPKSDKQTQQKTEGDQNQGQKRAESGNKKLTEQSEKMFAGNT